MSITIRIERGYTDYEIEQDGRGKLIEPKCPDCQVKVSRPKCFWELGDSCPRHELADAYRQALRLEVTNHDFKANGYDLLETSIYRSDPRCSLCGSFKSSHDEAQEEVGQ